MDFHEFRAGKGETDPEMDRLSEGIIGACIEVHKELGPGLNEKLYEEALCHELDLRGIKYERQVPVPVIYKGKRIGDTRVDLVVERQIVVELKSCEGFTPVHRAQCICYLQLLKLRLALLVNFNVAILKDGVKRVLPRI